MEQTVQFISDPQQAETALRGRVWQLQTGNHLQADVETALRGRRRFKDTLFIPFAKAILQYELLQEGDRVAVCISGGKDSMLMAKLFQELQRHRKFPFELVFLSMDPGYAAANKTLLQDNARALGVPLTVFESDIFDSVFHVEKSPCYLCARMRRGHLYKTAKDLGCNKIALGHHFDDVIETNLMSMLWGGQIQSMPPKLKSKNFPGMELIRPLYLVREADIEAWRDYHHLRFLACACRFTEHSEAHPEMSKRKETKALIAALHKTNPRVEANIFASMENVALDTVLGYRAKGEYHSFLENYIGEETT
ncbi:MAG: tRNA 2-thiocytidine biosynthesis protein TtcA [Clostridia bacterium]|nr:tRNA 2-thiocytidine biosynthesis protein TtcA [Clostridia bacterium]